MKLKTLTEDFDQDMKAAKAMKSEVESVFKDLEAIFRKINKNLSNFNSPGYRVAVLDAIEKNLTRNGFNLGGAKKHLDKYFDR